MKNILTTLFDVFVWGVLASLLFGSIYYFYDIRDRSKWADEQLAICNSMAGHAYLMNKTLTCYSKTSYSTSIFKITYPEKKVDTK